ncbi:hypothetical protein CERSUDRAFT_126501 [Gelatoporia subvermispora B]|uniref:Uncharacterized protein n=1 Tax=Ceriporiopsis subvermispora (strain B) TaxID=914234 RepID=M2Q876_CERS8|nr:hypothetical protein CERSUDRAFT_126501 [Gelatoporia subvermispora B]
MHLNHLSAGRDPAVLVPLQQDAAQDAEGDALSGLPMYQTSIGSPGPRAPRIRLFEHVETFAREEKVRLSIQAPVPPYTNGFDFQASSPKTSGEGKCPVFQSTFTRPQRVVRHMRFQDPATFAIPGAAQPSELRHAATSAAAVVFCISTSTRLRGMMYGHIGRGSTANPTLLPRLSLATDQRSRHVNKYASQKPLMTTAPNGRKGAAAASRATTSK